MTSSLMFRRRSMEKNWQLSGQETPEDEAELSKGTQDLFELLEKLQNNRLDDQRCVLPSSLQEHSAACHLPSSNYAEQELATYNADKDCQLLTRVLNAGGPFPMVVLPPSGGYSVESYDEDKVSFQGSFEEDLHGTSDLINYASSTVETDESAILYRKYFYNKEHYNFVINDSNVGPVVMSVKFETINGQEVLRAILRKKHDVVSDIIHSHENERFHALKVAKLLCDDISTDKFFAVLFPKASDLIMSFDEHVLINKLKFGIIYQKPGQITEEEMFGNETHSPAMEEFLQFLGTKTALKGFTGFRGGLDTHDGLTGEHSYYTQFSGVEIMFHVSTLLPYSKSDPQQLQRKRHIGNDVVAVIFQDENTPFMPSMIASHFLHTFIIVQVINPLSSDTRYKISVAYRDDVPYFGPKLPKHAVFQKSSEFRQFFLTKLINAEIASLKAKKFASLERRTRDSLLQTLHDNLLERTMDFCGFSIPSENNKSEIAGTSSGFFDSVRKALSGRNRSHSVESNLAHTTPKRSSSRASNSSLTGTLTGDTTPSTLRAQSSQIIDPSSQLNGDSSKDETDVVSLNNHGCQVRVKRAGSNPETSVPKSNTPPVMCESDSSSMNSLELERVVAPEDSDTGMESMSSADAPSVLALVSQAYPSHALLDADKVQGDAQTQDAELEVAKLKIEKLQLLKEIAACQIEMKKLKANEINLSAELSLRRQEVRRLAATLASYQNGHDSFV